MKNEIVFEDKCNLLLAYVKEHGELPTQKDSSKYHTYLVKIRYRYNSGNLDKSIIDKLSFTGIFKNPIDERWEVSYNKLLLYRKQHPDKWPSSSSKNIDESKLGKWCSYIRLWNKKNKLNKIWIEKLNDIGFNFTRNKNISAWQQNFEAVKLHFETNESTKGLSINQQQWCSDQFRKHYDKKLGFITVQQLDSIGFFKYVKGRERWEQKYVKMQEFIMLNKNKPTKISNKSLFLWWELQRKHYQSGSLSIEKIKLLEQLGLDVKTKKDDSETIWNRNYNTLNLFRENNNGRWPYSKKKGLERSLYIWCFEQRQNKLSIDKGLMNENKEHTGKLNAIGFKWSGKIINEERWDMMLNKLKEQYKVSKKIPFLIEGKINPLKSWIEKQEGNIKKNKISEDRKTRFLAVIQ